MLYTLIVHKITFGKYFGKNFEITILSRTILFTLIKTFEKFPLKKIITHTKGNTRLSEKLSKILVTSTYWLKVKKQLHLFLHLFEI